MKKTIPDTDMRLVIEQAMDRGPRRGEPVLTLRQPWATLVVEGVKPFEFRSWPTRIRGLLWIHAGGGRDNDVIRDVFPDLELPSSALVGCCYIANCWQASDIPTKVKAQHKHWLSGVTGFVWQIGMAGAIDPIPSSGKLGIWKW